MRATDLPSLSWPRGAQHGGRAGSFEGWLQRLTLDLSGLHRLIEEYWGMVVDVVSAAHQQYLICGPMDRPGIRQTQSHDFI